MMILIVVAGFHFIIVLFGIIRIFQICPADLHDTICIRVVGVIIHPARLHRSITVEVIVLAADLGPAVGYHLSAGGEIVPDRRSGSLVPCRIALRQFQPLVSRHDAGTLDKVFVVHPAVRRDVALGIEIAPEIVCSLLPGIRHLIAIVVHIYPAVSRLLPAFCRVRCQGRRPYHQRCGKDADCQFLFLHIQALPVHD